MKFRNLTAILALCFGLVFSFPAAAQTVLGSITGTVKDATGAAVPGGTITAENIGTNLTVTAHSDGNGSYLISNLPAGMYKVTFKKDGFDAETHTEVPVSGDRTTTVDSALKVGQVSTAVEVTSVPLMNQVDTTNGYVVDTRRFSGRRRLQRGIGKSGDLCRWPARHQQQLLAERREYEQSV
jgi:hypothetical protein